MQSTKGMGANEAYDPTKPYNAATNSVIEQTWGNADRWNLMIRRDGKRAEIIKDYRKPPWSRKGEAAGEKDATDGTGTKGSIHFKALTFDYAAQDGFAMVADDLIETGHVIYKLQDHLITESDTGKGAAAIRGAIEGLVKVCNEHNVIVTGGETAVLNTIDGFELGITGTGVRMYNPTGQLLQNDALIGLGSSGLHSNGFTFVRELYFDRLHYGLDSLVSGFVLGDALVRPTAIYLKELRRLLDEGGDKVHGLVHITGGGLTKLAELDPSGTLDISVAGPKMWPQPIFFDIFDRSRRYAGGLTVKEMFTKFNCGVGYVVAVDSGFAPRALDILCAHNPRIIGTAFPRDGEKSRVHIIDDPFKGMTFDLA